MPKMRYALFIIMLVVSTDYSFGVQENIITTVAGNGQAAFGGDGGHGVGAGPTGLSWG